MLNVLIIITVRRRKKRRKSSSNSVLQRVKGKLEVRDMFMA